jgi:DNA primase
MRELEMAKFENSFTDELRQRISIVDLVGRRVPLKKKGQNYWGCCPFHNEKTPSFSVNEDKGFYHCFGCGEHGDIISFTMKSNNMDFKSAIAELAQIAGLPMPDYKPKSAEQVAKEQTYCDIYENAVKIYQEKLFSESGKAALEYIRGRGFNDDTIKKYRIGYAPKANTLALKFASQKESNLIATGLVRRGDYGQYDFFRDKLMFPITNAKGQAVAFSGRSMDGSEPKYINTSDTELFHKRGTIFGLSYARDAIHKNNRSIVVEGQIDAIQMQTHGFPETLAPLGTALTEDHVQILCKHNRNIIFCFDGDAAGQKAAARALEISAPFMRETSDIRFAFVENGKDPDEVLKTGGENAMKKIIDNAISFVDYLWIAGNSKYNAKNDIGQTSAHKYMFGIIDKIEDDGRKNTIRQIIKDKEWAEWHRNIKNFKNENIEIPNIDSLTKNTLSFIDKNYPALIERYAEFLAAVKADFDGDESGVKLSENDAEKFLVALKLKNHVNNLRMQRTAALTEMTEESMAQIKQIDSDIAAANEKLNKLSGI